jgi:hypothetical protein
MTSEKHWLKQTSAWLVMGSLLAGCAPVAPYQRGYLVEYIRIFAPGLAAADIARAEAGAGSDFAI